MAQALERKKGKIFPVAVIEQQYSRYASRYVAGKEMCLDMSQVSAEAARDSILGWIDRKPV